MKGVKYIGSVWGRSGYSEAVRNYILAIDKAGIPITIEAMDFELNPPPLGDPALVAKLVSLTGKQIDYDVVIAHLTPDLFPSIRNTYPDKFIVGMTVWETSALHPDWADYCNTMNAIMVPSQWNVDSFIKSGVVVPVRKVIHGLDCNLFDNVRTKLHIPGTENKFKFLWIAQYHYRKNPAGLLRAYANAFTRNDNTVLIMKTYRGEMHSPEQDNAFVKGEINSILQDIEPQKRPLIYVTTSKMTGTEINELYNTADCLVSLHLGEGFGLVPAIGGLAGKPVIATGGTGNMEYMNETNSYPVNYEWVPVTGMDTFNRWYLADQQWTEPNIQDATEKMRHVYLNQEEAKSKGQKLSQDIKANFNIDTVGRIMVETLRELTAEQ